MNLHVPPEQMTWRARAYLTIGAARHILVGALSIVVSHDFDGTPWAVVINVLPLWIWGIVFLAGGLHLAFAAAIGDEGHARWGLVISASLTAGWATGFLLATLQGSVSAFLIGVLFAALSLKDFVVCAQPLRSPFEPVMRRYARPGRT